jgi:hypothetical protein
VCAHFVLQALQAREEVLAPFDEDSPGIREHHTLRHAQ